MQDVTLTKTVVALFRAARGSLYDRHRRHSLAYSFGMGVISTTPMAGVSRALLIGLSVCVAETASYCVRDYRRALRHGQLSGPR